MSKKKPWFTVDYAGLHFEYSMEANPYEEGTLHHQMHEKFEEIVWNVLSTPQEKTGL